MNKKTIYQLLLLVVLLGVAGWLLAQFHKPSIIQVVCDIHPPRVVRPNAKNVKRPAFEVAFGFDQKCALTSVKVVDVDEWTTNKNALPLWHMISESNSAPTKMITYGNGIRGMHPAIKGVRPKPLETNVTYRLLIEAGSGKGECDFKLPTSRDSGS